MPPKVKAKKWAQIDKDCLAELIDTENVDIEVPDHMTLPYIDLTRDEYFCHFIPRNFRTNYCAFVRQHSLAGDYDGARRNIRGKNNIILLLFIIII